jgi:pyrroline-5-carboxylate reductase
MGKKTIGIIGYGNMGAAIAQRVKPEFDICVFDKDNQKLSRASAVTVASGLSDLLGKSEIIILAIKPQDFVVVLTEIKNSIKDKLIISIAAGVTTTYIEKFLKQARVIRVMPNIAAIVGKGISYICKGEFATDNDWGISIKLFNLIGHTFVIEESLMNAATAIGGSGPGFWGYLIENLPESERAEFESKSFIPQLTNAAVKLGLDQGKARLSAELVVNGSRVMVNLLNITPKELVEKVASKGGTTEAGLEILKNGGTLTEAIDAATKRAKELSKKE